MITIICTILAVALALVCADPPKAVLFALWPNKGSIAGGTYLTLKGVGWTRGGQPGVTKVYVGGKECKQNQGVVLDSTDTNYVCWTPSYIGTGKYLDDGSLNPWVLVTVKMITLSGQVSWATCGGSCYFQYTESATPVVEFASMGTSAGGIVKISGYLRGLQSTMYWVRIGGDTRGGGVGGSLCSVDAKLQVGYDGFSGATKMINPAYAYWYYGYRSKAVLFCRVAGDNSSIEAGRYPLFLEPRDNGPTGYGFGQPVFSMRASQNFSMLPNDVSGKSTGLPAGQTLASTTGFGITVFPVINNISLSRIGTGGESEITITGAGFSTDATQNTVLIGDNIPCRIISSSITHITCLSGESPSSSPAPKKGVYYVGGTGLLRKVFVKSAMPTTAENNAFNTYYYALDSAFYYYSNTRGSDGNLKSLNEPKLPLVTPTFVDIDLDSLTSYFFYEGLYKVEYYVQEFTGYFVAPVTANYSFYCRGDDRVAVYLSKDENPKNLSLIAISNTYNNDWWTRLPDIQISRKIEMKEGQAYYFRTLFVELYGGDYFDVALRIHTENGTNQDVINMFSSEAQKYSRSAMNVQKIEIAADSGTLEFVLNYGSGDMVTSVIPMSNLMDDSAWNTIVSSFIDATGGASGTPFTNVRDTYLSNHPLDTGGSGFRFIQGPSYDSIKKKFTLMLMFYGPIAASLQTIRVLTSGTASNGATFALVNSLGDAVAKVTQIEEGGNDPFYWPVPMDFFRTALTRPAVKVTSNGLLASCNHYLPTSFPANVSSYPFNVVGQNGYYAGYNNKTDRCTISYDSALNPIITNFTVTAPDGSDAFEAGSIIHLYGSGFLSESSGIGRGPGGRNLTATELNQIILTGVTEDLSNVTALCEVFYATETQLACSVPHTAAGNYSIRIIVGLGHGKADFETQLTYTTVIDSVYPNIGSRAGGTLLVISGSGFSNRADGHTVTIGGYECTLLSYTPGNITCLTPPLVDNVTTPDAIASNLVVNKPLVVGGILVDGGFDYSAELTPIITDMTPTSLSTATSGTINLIVSNINIAFFSSVDFNSSSLSILFGGRSCLIRHADMIPVDSDTMEANITCLLIRTETQDLPQYPVLPYVLLGTYGAAAIDSFSAPDGGWSLDTGYRITGVSPDIGSLAGGTRVTVTGVGFDGLKSATYVDFWSTNTEVPNKVACTVDTIASDGTSIECIMSRPDFENNNDLANWKDSYVFGYLSVVTNTMESKCSASNNCTFIFLNESTPRIASVSYNKTNRLAYIDGSLLAPPLRVWFGTTEADVISCANDSAIVAIPEQTCGNSSLFVHSGVYGNVEGAWGYKFDNPLSVFSVSSQTGSVSGGHAITITGRGFSDTPARNLVYFGTVLGTVIECNSIHMVVRTPVVAASTVKITVAVLDQYRVNRIATVVTSFSYVFSATATPVLTSCKPTTIVPGNTLTIRGTGFGASSSSNSVMVGNQPCSIKLWNSTLVTCTLGSTPAGTHYVMVFSQTGLASKASTYPVTVALTVSSASDVNIGAGGGASITIGGSGFSPVTTDNWVQICGRNATVTSSSSSSIIVTAPALPTASTNDLYNTFESTVLKGVVSGSTLSQAPFAFDGLASTKFTSCQLTLDLGADTSAVVTRLRFFPVLGMYKSFEGSRFSAAQSSSGPWTTLWNVPASGVVVDGWNYHDLDILDWDVTEAPKYRYLRWDSGATGSTCVGMEVEFVGKPLVRGDGKNCSLTVQVATPKTAFTNAVQSSLVPLKAKVVVNATETPVVYSISPDIGTALGGDTITITGSGFLPGVNSVYFNEMPCTVTQNTDTTITCVTTKRTEILPFSVKVDIAGLGLALVNDTTTTYFSYLDKWSELSTWLNDEPPGEGDTVIVPKGQAILVDVSPPKLFLVLVQGTMTFDHSVPELFFDAHYIFVLGGTMQAGTESRPYMNKLTVTLHGDRDTSIEIPGVGAKCIGVMNAMSDNSTSLPMDDEAVAQRSLVDEMESVMGADFGINLAVFQYSSAAAKVTTPDPLTALLGTSAAPAPGSVVPTELRGVVEFHGAPRERVWTFGGAPAPAGSTNITTLEDVDFAIGEEIVISSTSYRGNEAERAFIVDVIDSKHFVIDKPLIYDHDCFVYEGAPIGHSDTLICFEVGLLSRNIVIQGDENSDAQQFGVHTIAAMGSTMRIHNIEMRKCGQSLIVGRYCSHFHLSSDVGESYVKANSFHDGFQRAVTVHATNNLIVADNVAYRIMAHSFFIEDGNEFNNVMSGNLVVDQLLSPGPIRSDAQAACFWTASPANIWRDNVCAGSPGNGYWFQPPPAPTGPSATDRIVPYELPLGAFENNTAHGTPCGLNVWIAGAPILCSTVPQQLVNNTFWRNGQGAFIGEVHSNVQFVGTKYIENNQGDMFWFHMACKSTYGWRPQLLDNLFVSTMDPVNNPVPTGSRGGALFPEDEYLYASGLTFVNYKSSGAISTCVDNGCVCGWSGGSPLASDTLQPYGYTARVERLRFIDSNVRIFWDRTDILWDLDGSLTGNKNSIAMPYHAYNDWPECKRDTAGKLGYGVSCNSNVTARRVAISGVAPYYAMTSQIFISGGSSLGKWGPSNRTAPVLYHQLAGQHLAVLVTGHYYGLKFNTNQDWQKFTLKYSEADYLAEAKANEYTGLTFTWIQKRYYNPTYYPGGFSCTEPPCPGQSVLPILKRNALPGPSDIFGTGNMPSGASNNTWSVALTRKLPVNNSLFNSTHTGVGLPGSMAYSFDVRFSTCPPQGCSAGPGIGNLGPPQLWSTLTWPATGEDITIAATDYIILDVSPPAIGNLVIEGRLEFSDTVDNLKLTAKTILVWGSLIVGSTTTPRTKNAEIVLTGNLMSPDVQLSNSVILGNKNLVVFGNATFVGPQPTETWVRLATTATAGSTSITLATPVLASSKGGAWVAGNRIVLSATEYSPSNSSYSETEVAEISSVSSNGLTLTLTKALKYTHFAGPLSTNQNSAVSKIRLAAAVGLLTRNIVIRGDVSSDNSDPAYGGHLYVGSISMGTGASTRKFAGQLYASSIEFRDMGKETMVSAAINLEYLSGLPTKANTINNCVFTNGHHGGIISHGSSGTVISGNVFLQTFKNGIYVDQRSSKIVIQKNFIAGNYMAPDTYCCGRMENFQVYPQAAIALTIRPLVLADNFVSDAVDIGYIIPGEDCSVKTPYMKDNEAVGVAVGFYVSPFASSSRCLLLDRAVVWKAAHIGILAQDHSANFRLSNSLVSDSHIGVNFFFGVFSTQLLWSEVVNTTIVGSSAASSCSKSVVCRAFTKGDRFAKNCNSVFGSNVHHAGILVPSYTNDGKGRAAPAADAAILPGGWLGCALPWESHFGASRGPFTQMRLVNVVFSGFSSTSCDKQSFALAMNPGEKDLTTPVYASKITWDNVDSNARFHLGTSVRPLMIDTDNTLVGQGAGASLIGSASAALAKAFPSCSLNDNFGGYVCVKTPFRSAVFMDIDMESSGAPAAVSVRTESILQPAYVSVFNGAANGTILYSYDVNGGCTLCLHNPDTINFLTLPGTRTHIRLKASEPIQSRIYLSSTNTSEKFLYSIFLTKPNSQSLFIDGVRINTLNDLNPSTPPANLPIPTVADPAGTALFRPDLRTFFFVASGGLHYYDIVRNPSIMVAVSFTVPSGTELDTNKVATTLAALLGISPSRIRVVSVHSRRRLSRQLRANDIYESMERELADATSQLQLEILPATPVVALAPSTESSVATTADSSTDDDTTTETPTTSENSTVAAKQAVFEQQSSMVGLSATLQNLANTGAMQASLQNATGYAVADVGVTAPTLSVADPTSTGITQRVKGTVTIEFSNLPAIAFDDSTGAPTSATLDFLHDALVEALKDKGQSQVDVNVTSVVNGDIGGYLYTRALSDFKTPASVVVSYNVSTASSALVTLVKSIASTSSFCNNAASHLAGYFQVTSITGKPYVVRPFTMYPTAAPTSKPSVKIAVKLSNMPESAFDTTGAPKNKTIDSLNQAMATTLTALGESDFKVNVFSVVDAVTGATLYTNDVRRRLDTRKSIGVQFKITASPSFVSSAPTLAQGTSFTSSFATNVGTELGDNTIVGEPYTGLDNDDNSSGKEKKAPPLNDGAFAGVVIAIISAFAGIGFFLWSYYKSAKSKVSPIHFKPKQILPNT